MSENYVGRPPGPQAFTFATQAEMELAAALDRIVAPGTQKFHPAAAKAWVVFDATGGVVAIKASYNVAAVRRIAAGQFMIDFGVPFSSAFYSGCYNCGNGVCDSAAVPGAKTAASAPMRTYASATGAYNDPVDCQAIFYGDQ